jgi:hypothetical protein
MLVGSYASCRQQSESPQRLVVHSPSSPHMCNTEDDVHARCIGRPARPSRIEPHQESLHRCWHSLRLIALPR